MSVPLSCDLSFIYPVSVPYSPLWSIYLGAALSGALLSESIRRRVAEEDEDENEEEEEEEEDESDSRDDGEGRIFIPLKINNNFL